MKVSLRPTVREKFVQEEFNVPPAVSEDSCDFARDAGKEEQCIEEKADSDDTIPVVSHLPSENRDEGDAVQYHGQHEFHQPTLALAPKESQSSTSSVPPVPPRPVGHCFSSDSQQLMGHTSASSASSTLEESKLSEAGPQVTASTSSGLGVASPLDQRTSQEPLKQNIGAARRKQPHRRRRWPTPPGEHAPHRWMRNQSRPLRGSSTSRSSSSIPPRRWEDDSSASYEMIENTAASLLLALLKNSQPSPGRYWQQVRMS